MIDGGVGISLQYVVQHIFDASTGGTLTVLQALYVLLRRLTKALGFSRQFPDGRQVVDLFQLLADLFKVVGGAEVVADAGAVMADIGGYDVAMGVAGIHSGIA